MSKKRNTLSSVRHSLIYSLLLSGACGGRAGLDGSLGTDQETPASSNNQNDDLLTSTGGAEGAIGGSFAVGGARTTPGGSSSNSSGGSPADGGSAPSDGGALQTDTGGSSTNSDCPEGSFDSLIPAPNPCVPWSTCSPGSFVSQVGTVHLDQECQDCPDGSYTDEEDLNSCQAHATCTIGEQVKEAGTSTSDVTCKPSSEFPLHQFGSESMTGKLVVAGERLHLLSQSFTEYSTQIIGYDSNGKNLAAHSIPQSPTTLQAIAPHGDSIYVSTIEGTDDGTAALIRKLDAQGVTIWENSFRIEDEWVSNVRLVTHQDALLVAGVFYNGVHVSYDIVVGRYTHDGELEWQQVFEMPGNNQVFDIDLADDGQLYLVGYSAMNSESAYVVQISEEGQLLTSQTSSALKCSACTELTRGAGSSMFTVGAANDKSPLSEAPDAYPAVVTELDQNGSVLDSYRFPVGTDDRIQDALFTESGIHLVGAAEGDALFIVIDTKGELISRTTVGGAAQEIATGIAQTADGRIFVGGHTNSSASEGAFVIPWPE